MKSFLTFIMIVIGFTCCRQSYANDLFEDPITLFSDVYAKVLSRFERAKVQTTWGGFYLRADTQNGFKNEFIPSKAGILFSVKVRDATDIPKFEDKATSENGQITRTVKFPSLHKDQQGLSVYYVYGADADAKAISTISLSIDSLIKKAEQGAAANP